MDTQCSPIRPDVLNPGARVEHWRILESLGQRGQGALFRVEDVRCPGEPLVMKLSLRPGEGRFGDRVARRMAAHPNLAKLHACGHWPQPGGGFFYSVREEVRGPSLAAWVEAVNPTFLQIAALVSRLGSVIDQMHARDTWHRELHPHNLQVRETDSEPVLLDLRDGGNEALDTLLKTPLSPELQVFRSPEALRFLRSNGGRPQACYRYLTTDDLYSLGALAYWLATGHPPFPTGLSPEQLHTAVELRAPVPPWEVNPRVPKPLGAIILRLMSKLPEARPPSGETLCAELMVAVSAGARAMWARRVFDWARDEAGQEAVPRRVLRPEAPQVSLQPGPKLPRVVYFNPPAEPRLPVAASPSSKPRVFGGDFGGPPGPWSRMM
jgi:eukaryotic-like serine/threonine-protein kinase